MGNFKYYVNFLVVFGISGYGVFICITRLDYLFVLFVFVVLMTKRFYTFKHL